MAQLDVTDVLDDPDFVDVGIVCVRNMQTMGTDGLAVNSSRRHYFDGVVISDSGDMLQRLPDGERVKGSITIFTKFTLMDGCKNATADVVCWRGANYTVSSVSDYSNFATGFVKANCDLIPLAG